MDFTDLLDEYLSLKVGYDTSSLNADDYCRFAEVKEELNRRARGEH
jgi:hypothetical protein